MKISYKKKGDGDWTVLGYCDDDSYSYTASPRAITYPDETTTVFDLNVTSEWVQFKFDFASTLDELSPLLKRFTVNARLINSMDGVSTSKNDIEMVIDASRNRKNLAGVVESRTVDKIISQVEELRDMSFFQVTGPDDKKYKVRMAIGGISRQAAKDEPDKEPEFQIAVKMQEI